jgi:hypothetical protein
MTTTEGGNMSVAPVIDEEAIFDAKAYDLPIPKLDGHKADKLVLAFGGTVELDRTLEDDLAMIEKLHLGEDVEFQITATVAGKGFSHATKGEDGETVGYQVRLRVHSVQT